MESTKKKYIGIILTIGLITATPLTYTYANNMQLVSRGAVTYDSDGDGIEETLLDSEDLRKINAAIKEASNSQSEYASQLEELLNEMEQCKADVDTSNKTLINSKEKLIASLQEKFPGVDLIDKLTKDSSFDDIVKGINSLAAPSKVTASPFTMGDNGNLGVDLKNGKAETDYKTEYNLGIKESITLPAGYYNTDTTIDNDVKDNGDVIVNFTKASQTASLEAGYYDSILLDTKQLYMDGYMDGKAQTTTQNVYNTVAVNPGTNGSFKDGTKKEKTFTGPNYTGLDMNVVPDDGYIFDKWDISVSKSKIIMTASYKKAVITQDHYKQFLNGENLFYNKKVTELTFTASSYRDFCNYFAPNPRGAEIDLVYDIYIDNELYKSVALHSVGGTHLHPDSNVYDARVSERLESSTSTSNSIKFDRPMNNVKVVCSKGNYLGSIATDMVVTGY